MENDLGIMRVVSLMNTSALSPLNAQQWPGWIGPYHKITKQHRHTKHTQNQIRNMNTYRLNLIISFVADTLLAISSEEEDENN